MSSPSPPQGWCWAWLLPHGRRAGGGGYTACPPQETGRRGCQAGGGGRWVRGSPEPGADLISRGQLFVKHIWQRAGPNPADCPPPQAWRYLPGMLAAPLASGACFWGSRRPLRRLARGWGWAPPRPDFLAPPSSCRCGSRVGLPLGPETERAADVMWLSSWEECGTSGPAAWPPLAERGN